MPSRTQVTLDAELDRKAKERARALGISFAEYVRRLVAADLNDEKPRTTSLRHLFGRGASGGSHIARHKDEYLGQATTNRTSR